MSTRTLTATEKLQQEAREKWGTASPFRIGYLAGWSGSIAGSVNPYEPGSRGHKCFEDGLAAAVKDKEQP